MANVYATVGINLEINLGQPWSDEDNLAQLRKSAKEEAYRRISNALNSTKFNLSATITKIDVTSIQFKDTK